ncbi:MAG: PD40 domain-containing protein [Nitrospirae bacterium]|nr:PD40 domain-containing protein [Nitrospirota bacterium]
MATPRTALRRAAPPALLLALTLAACGGGEVASFVATIARVSLDPFGFQANGASTQAAITPDGRYTAFTSAANNLLVSDTNGVADVFRYDRLTDTLARVSVNNAGFAGSGASGSPAISADGRYVAFMSLSALVNTDTNGVADVYLRDTLAGTTTRVSPDVFDGPADGASDAPAISADGKYVAFASLASDLVAGDTNGVADIFLRDTLAGTTTRISVDTAGTDANGPSRAPAISADGGLVAFESDASDLVTADGNAVADVFRRDTVSATTARVSVDTAGTDANGPSRAPAISADGGLVAFESDASDLVTGDGNAVADVFLRDTASGTTTRHSVNDLGGQANQPSRHPALSGDGTVLAFVSGASNLVDDDSNGTAIDDLFLRYPATATTVRVTDGRFGQANGASAAPVLNTDGTVLAFESAAFNLVTNDTNGLVDLFRATVP